MRIGIVGGGEIARLFLERLASGELGDATVVALAGRSERLFTTSVTYKIPLAEWQQRA